MAIVRRNGRGLLRPLVLAGAVAPLALLVLLALGVAVLLIIYSASPSEASAYRSCNAIKIAGASVGNGVYTIDPDDGGPLGSVQVQCDMERDGGGWTLGVKSWYQSGVHGMIGPVGAVADGLTLKGNPYKLSDDVIRAIIGPTENFDVLADQNGYNLSYSTGNFEYVVLRNYTGYWRFDAPVSDSSTQTVMESYRASDNALAWTGELQCGVGGAGINCRDVVTNNPQGGAGCAINMGTASNAGWHHFFMSEVNSDTYLYICNGAQHSSGYNMNHRWWFRETATPTPKPTPTHTPTITPTPTISPTPTITPTPTKLPDPGDTDGDGCSDQRENGLDETLGGLRDYKNPWDFFDPAKPKDQYIDLPNDILGVILRYTAGGGVYHANYDRGPSAGPNAWNMTAPDGTIDLPNDILGVILQYQHDCR